MNKWTHRGISVLVFTILLFTVTKCHKEWSLDYRYYHIHHESDTLSTYIALRGDAFAFEDFPVGFQYRLLSHYATDQHTTARIFPPYYIESPWESLDSGKLDIIVFDTQRDTIPDTFMGRISMSIPIAERYVWIVRKEDRKLLHNINYWLGIFSQSPEFYALERSFLRVYRIKHHLDNMTQTAVISPYDHLIKRYSRTLDWDWRLVAALICQESRFSMGAISRRGAIGLMQVKESTALHYGVSDIFNPENNIKAGTRHLRYLENMFIREGMDSSNVVKFTLAAYNAGEGRIQECMEFCREVGADYKDWEEMCRIIPLMRNPQQHIPGTTVKRFNGTETIRYVDEILSRYEEYRFAVLP
jgi:membrane-bound lytic murein transglycosylase F